MPAPYRCGCPREQVEACPACNICRGHCRCDFQRGVRKGRHALTTAEREAQDAARAVARQAKEKAAEEQLAARIAHWEALSPEERQQSVVIGRGGRSALIAALALGALAIPPRGGKY